MLGVLGEGGMARVYEGEHVVLGKRVAIKTLRPEFALYREARDMLVREARIGAAIRHPHLVEVFDFGTDSRGRPYAVMELVAGAPLQGPLPTFHCLDIAVRLTGAVAAMHAAGYLHRDVKCDNVLVTDVGGRWLPKLIDFGISTPAASAANDGRVSIVGTPRTMSPEQIAQDTVDERSDLWALGVVLYELLTGRSPFPTGGTIRDDLLAIVSEPFGPLPDNLAHDVRAIVADCLAKEPDDRPPSAAALAHRLRAARAAHVARHRSIERILRA